MIGRARISPLEAIEKAHAFDGKALPTIALTLLIADGKDFHQAIGGMGAESLLIDAETGEVLQGPGARPDFQRGAFLLFRRQLAGHALLVFSALAAISALTGYLPEYRLLGLEESRKAR